MDNEYRTGRVLHCCIVLYILKKEPVLCPEVSQIRFFIRMIRTNSWPWDSYGIAIPAITASGTMIMQAAINLFGATAVASFSAASKIQNMLTQGMMAIGQTMATYSGQNYGAGEIERIKKGVRCIDYRCQFILYWQDFWHTLDCLYCCVSFEAGTDMTQVNVPCQKVYSTLHPCSIYRLV